MVLALRSSRLAVLALLASTAGAAFAQKVTLQFMPPVGKNYNYVMTNDIKSAASAGLGMNQNISVLVSILSKSAPGTKVRMKITDVKVKSPAGSPAAANMEQVRKQMVGSTTDMVYDARARMVGTPTSSNPRMQQMMGSMGGMGTGFMGVEFPAGPVGPGSKWNTTIDLGKVMGGAMPMMQMGKNSKIPVAYTLQKVENKGGKKLATIAVVISGKMDLSMGQGRPGGQSMKIGLNMNTKGTMVVDMATGIPSSGKSAGTVEISMNGQRSMTQTLSTTFRLK